MRNGQDFSEQDLTSAEEKIGYVFEDKELLKTCFTHKSYSNLKGGENNERLEFLGDAVLGFCIAEQLYKSCGEDEGSLTEQRQRLVSKTALEQATERADLKRFLRYSGGENNVGGKTASNLFEAVIGAIYLDGGIENVRKFLKKYLKGIDEKNYKTLLQEYVQEREKKTPRYTALPMQGENHCAAVSALGKVAQGTGKNKQTAEAQAAKILYQMLTKEQEH